MGDELADFLRERDVSVMACCPTLLATIEQDLPKLRLLLVGGEACPQNLVARWHKPGRRILNSYGPTEATVTATLTELRPDKPVTIGVPLSTYTIVILDPNEDKTVEPGELGEIGIAGVGLALGYMNREELTMKKFIRDFLNIQNNPSGRIYRTGDLGRIDENGEIEYRGRIDTQVKIRGYRIELNEIEAVLLDLPQIAQAAVTTFEPEPDVVELVAYYAFKQGAELPRDEISQALRAKLPPYMVPAFLEELPAIPMTLSNKADHKRLPKPQLARFSSATSGYVAPKTENERILHSALCEVLRVDRVSTEHHFFDDLGANSLLMARVCATIRKNPRMANVSMRDIYTNPTIARLADHLDKVIGGVVATKPEPFHVPSNLAYYTCGAMQAVFYAAYALFGLWVLDTGYEWTVAASGAVELYVRAVVLRGGFVRRAHRHLDPRQVAADRPVRGRHDPDLELCLFPLLGRQVHDADLAGDGLHRHAHLQRLSAPDGREDRQRRGAELPLRAGLRRPACRSATTPSCARTRLSSATVRSRTSFISARSRSARTPSWAKRASSISTRRWATTRSSAMPRRCRAASTCRTANAITARPRSRPRRTTARSRAAKSARCAAPCSPRSSSPPWFSSRCRVPILAYSFWEQYATAAGIGAGVSALSLLGVSAALFFGSILAGLVSIYVIPRLCMLFLKPGVTYTAFGFHYLMQSIIQRASNSEFFCVLFGDSTFITTWMSKVGWNLNKVEQTGSNMGTNQRHDNPFLCNIGSGTMVSDGLSMINTHMSATSFQLAEAKIGEHNYLGNDIFYPPNGKTGVNVLLGTKTMIPIDGEVRENTGLLGSPAFEIPRMVDRDRDMNASFDEETRRARLRQKNRYNLVTALIFLAARWMSFFAALVLWMAALAYYDRFGVFALFAATVAIAGASIVMFVLLERASLAFKRLEPKIASIYDPYFWFHERHWKLSEFPITSLFSGTPFRTMMFRAMGMKIGAKVFDCGRSITERTLTEVGDYANVNEGCVLQAHSLEEGVFKSDHIRIGNGCSIGPGAFVHYGVTMGDHVVLDADSFLMKGEVLDSAYRLAWQSGEAGAPFSGRNRGRVRIPDRCGVGARGLRG